MRRKTVNPVWPFAGLYLSLVVPSLGQVQKYFGTVGIFLYAVGVFIALFVLYRYCVEKILSQITDKQASFILVITIIYLIIIFFIAYPSVNSGIVNGGSDRDEDVNLAVNELFNLRYPYYQKTYLGNSITHFPGSLLLSALFVLLGNSVYQNFFWLSVFLIIAKIYLGEVRLTLFMFWVIVFCSPAIMQEFVTGGDLMSNSIYILSFIFFMVNSISGFGAKKWKNILSAVLLGIGFSSRLNFILLSPLVFSTLVQTTGFKSAVRYFSLVCLTFLAVTLPFYLYDPKGFSPLYGQFNKIGQYNEILPFAGILIPLIGGILALALSFQRMDRDCVVLFRNCMFVQLFLVLSAVALDTIKGARLSLILSGYGINFLFFGVLTFWERLTKDISLARS